MSCECQARVQAANYQTHSRSLSLSIYLSFFLFFLSPSPHAHVLTQVGTAPTLCRHWTCDVFIYSCTTLVVVTLQGLLTACVKKIKCWIKLIAESNERSRRWTRDVFFLLFLLTLFQNFHGCFIPCGLAGITGDTQSMMGIATFSHYVPSLASLHKKEEHTGLSTIN